MGIRQSSILKIKAKILKNPKRAFRDPERVDLSEIDQEPLPFTDANYQNWRSEYVRPWNDMFYIDYNKKKEVKESGAVTCSEAIGYGMLISVLMRNQKDFDGLMR
ncbi:hypothetical protein BGZ81_004457, partial [Podila clonocystis]